MDNLTRIKNLKAASGLAALNVLRIASAVAALQTVTIGSTVYQVNVGAGVVAGRVSVDVSAGGTKSTGTLTQTANPTDGETVVIGSRTYTFKTALTGAANEVLIGASCVASMSNLIAAVNAAAGAGTTYGSGTTVNADAVAAVGTPVKATGTLTSDGTAPTDGDTVVLNGKTYTFQDTLTDVDGNVLIGASAATALDNLKSAVNLSAGAGTTYATSTTAHPTLVATTNTDTTQVFEAITAGGAGNLLTTVEVGTHTSFGAATLTGGSDKVGLTARYTGVTGDTVATTETLANGSFGAATLGSGVDPTAEQFVDALVAAIPVTELYSATKISANEVLFKMLVPGRNVTAVSETLTGSNNGWSAATFYGGADELDELQKTRGVTRVPTATEVALDTMHFGFGFSPTSAIAQVRSSAGALKAYDGSLTISGNRVTLTSDGSTDIEANDIVTVIAFD